LRASKHLLLRYHIHRTMRVFSESHMEQIILDWLQDLGKLYTFGHEIAFDGAVRKLARLRDGLLPKLVRGEVRVKDVEKFL
jgi:hypothetical protein